tara:strand:+ start:21616 stop:21927 length:312 start_codon:yes stop_codon:yes gene_type:complete
MNDINILSVVCDYYGLSKQQILSHRRKKNLIKARHASYWLYENLTDYSYPRIGRIHKRDHTTIMHGCNRIDEAIKNQTEESNIINKIYNQLSSHNKDQMELAL